MFKILSKILTQTLETLAPVTKVLIVTALFSISYTPLALGKIKHSGILQLGFIAADNETSFLNGGAGRFIHDDNGVNLTQAFINVTGDITDSISAQVIANHSQNPESRTGITQALLKYKPIPTSRYNFQYKLGIFYPAMSFENVDLGWTSPFTYTNSAINSWIGEEIRINGFEAKLNRPGKRFGSYHSFASTFGLYKGNDPTGTLLAWRGFALHDKQTQLGEKIYFVNFPSIQIPPLDKQDDYVDVFREIDGKVGYYIGGHWDYRRKSKFRYYYYDNRADPLAVNGGQYSWHTEFHSLSWQYRPAKGWRIIAQYLNGKTEMGPKAVYLDYRAFFLLVGYKYQQHRFTTRYDKFGTANKNNLLPYDDSDSDGQALTLTWRYSISKQFQVGAELVKVESTQDNRLQLSQSTKINQDQAMVIFQYRF